MASCVVSGTFLDPSGSAISGATVRFNIGAPAYDAGLSNVLSPKEISTLTAADGTWSLTISQGASGKLTLDCPPDAVSGRVRYVFSVIVPSTPTATFSQVWSDSQNVASATYPLSFSQLQGTLSANQLPATINANLVGNVTGNVTGSAGTAALLTGNLTGDVTSVGMATTLGTVGIAKGGTGQTTKAAAFDALSPMSASGDIVYGGASGTGTRLPKGSDGQIMVLASGLPSWGSASASGATFYYGAGVPEGATGVSVAWTHLGSGASTDPNTGSLQKSSFNASWLGAYSDQEITSGTAWSLTVGISDITKNLIVGTVVAANISSSTDYYNYGLSISASKVYAYEKQVNQTPSGTSFTAGDVLSLVSDGSTVLYKKNGVTWYTSTQATPAASLYPQASLYEIAVAITDCKVKIGSATVGASGDTYVDTSTEAIYQKAGSTWTRVSDEKVGARYFSSATTISGTLATIVWGIKDWDDHLMVSSGVATIQTGQSGKYLVNAGVLVAATIAANDTLIMEIQKNGTVVTRKKIYLPASLTACPVSVSDEVNAAAGDAIRIQVSCSSTSPSIVSSSVDNYFSIAKVAP